MDRPATKGRTARHSDRGRPCHPSTAKEGRDGHDHRRTCAHRDRWRRHYLDVHVAAALDPLGGLLGSQPFETTPTGYKALLIWLEGFGEVGKVGVEGTGSDGAGLARFLRRRRIEVVEVDRPNRTGPPRVTLTTGSGGYLRCHRVTAHRGYPLGPLLTAQARTALSGRCSKVSGIPEGVDR